MINSEDLFTVEDPLELFNLTTAALAEHQEEIDRLAVIRARAIAALYAQGRSYKELSQDLGISAPRIGQLVNANDVAEIQLLKGWHSIERRLAQLSERASGKLSSRFLDDALKLIYASHRFDRAAVEDLATLRMARNELVHGMRKFTPVEVEVFLDKIIYLSALIDLLIRDMSVDADGNDGSNERLETMAKIEVERRHDELAPAVRVSYREVVNPRTGDHGLVAEVENRANRPYRFTCQGSWSSGGTTEFGSGELEALGITQIHLGSLRMRMVDKIQINYRADEWDVPCPCTRPDEYGHWVDRRKVKFSSGES
ncbi:hypothetical protein AB0J72_19925 [Dactylosporangium sp. NPDC049742]|uniref:hypothetical protein n=1 Tax=Dactylosporangium sp. NPDC049742 TaxID=3154737 RepID=UPI00341D0824